MFIARSRGGGVGCVEGRGNEAIRRKRRRGKSEGGEGNRRVSGSEEGAGREAGRREGSRSRRAVRGERQREAGRGEEPEGGGGDRPTDRP